MRKPTHYFCLTTHELVAKNSLEKAFVNYLKSLNGKLVTANPLEFLQEEIIAKSNAFNTEFKRCKPIQLSFYKTDNDTNYRLSGFYTIGFAIHNAYIDEPLKKYKIPELRVEIYARNDEEFEAKREKLINRHNY